jgi:predicted amidophosphoribosyltransferase
MPEGLLQLEWCAMYSGPVRAALHALTYRGERRLSRPLGEAMAARWRMAGRGGDLVTWVPVHESRRRERGFDQAQELAEVMAAALELPVARCLQRRQRTAALHDLGQAERARHTAGAFVAAPKATEALPGRWVIVVDDIMTTGATLAGCAAALYEAGAGAVSGMSVARDR